MARRARQPRHRRRRPDARADRRHAAAPATPTPSATPAGPPSSAVGASSASTPRRCCSDLPAAPTSGRGSRRPCRADEPVGLFLHRPLRPWRGDTPDDPRRYVSGHRTVAPRRRCSPRTGAPRRERPRAPVVGRRARRRRSTCGRRRRGRCVPDQLQPVIGAKVVGLSSTSCDRGRHRAIDVRPPGRRHRPAHRRRLPVAVRALTGEPAEAAPSHYGLRRGPQGPTREGAPCRLARR